MTHGKTERLLLDAVDYLNAHPSKRVFFVVHRRDFKGHVMALASKNKVSEETFKRIDFVTPQQFADRSSGCVQSVYVDHFATHRLATPLAAREAFWQALDSLKERQLRHGGHK